MPNGFKGRCAVKVSTCTGPVILECAGCGMTREVPRGAALRTLVMHANRFKREHTVRCEVKAAMQRDYDKAGRVASKIISQFTGGA